MPDLQRAQHSSGFLDLGFAEDGSSFIQLLHECIERALNFRNTPLLTSRAVSHACGEPVHVANFFGVKPVDKATERNKRAPHHFTDAPARIERKPDLKLSANLTKAHI